MSNKVIKNEEELIAEIRRLVDKLAQDVERIKIDTDQHIATELEKRRQEEIEKIKKDILNS